MTYAELEAQLFARARMGVKPGLERMQVALASLGDPHLCAPSFHVAGTNGKGSTCAFIESVCRRAGLRTGLFTSPHLERFGERFQVSGADATPDELLAYYDELRRRLPPMLLSDEGLTFFELVTLLGFLRFANAGVDMMVVEVGMGGRLDSTNVLSPLASCITSIGLDHREFLGSTLGEIAREKAGILRPGIPAAIARQEREAAEAIRKSASAVGAPLHEEGDSFSLTPEGGALVYRSTGWELSGLELGLPGPHQRSNAGVAIRALELAAHRLGLDARHVREGLSAARWPGRLETIGSSPAIVLDGAHNPPAARALASSIAGMWPGRKVHLVVGLLGDKDAGETLGPLLGLAESVIVTAPHSPRALAPATLQALASRSHPRVESASGVEEAIARSVARAAPEDVVLVFGSLYLIGEARAALHGRIAGGPREILHRGSHGNPRS